MTETPTKAQALEDVSDFERQNNPEPNSPNADRIERLRAFITAQPDAPAEVAGLEWLSQGGRHLVYNSVQIGAVVGLNGPGDPYETEIAWTYYLGSLFMDNGPRLNSEEAARAALWKAATEWLRPIPVSIEQIAKAIYYADPEQEERSAHGLLYEAGLRRYTETYEWDELDERFPWAKKRAMLQAEAALQSFKASAGEG
jgi:hypothetical protein